MERISRHGVSLYEPGFLHADEWEDTAAPLSTCGPEESFAKMHPVVSCASLPLPFQPASFGPSERAMRFLGEDGCGAGIRPRSPLFAREFSSSCNLE